ncbi:MAG: TolC family protein [Bacteroidales bacterium]|nr:TolC family protein [Bacteroidales bacterium]
MHRFNTLILGLLSFFALPVSAQQVLTLDQCHQLALQSNNSIKILKEKAAESEDLRKLALSEFFPRFSANALYHWNEKNISILSDQQKQNLSTIGDQATSNLASAVQSPLLSSILGAVLAEPLSNMASDLNGLGQQIVDDFDISSRNVFVGGVTMTQPIFLGGKIREAYRMARLSAELAGIQYDKGQEDLLVSVDEAYWHVVSLQHKVELARQYCKLLEDLSRDVDAMVEAEVATRADQTKVRVNLNEAQMKLTQAINGLDMYRMLLFQLCDLDLRGDYQIVEDSTWVNLQSYSNINMQAVWDSRSELKMLNIAEQMAHSTVRLAVSNLLPNIAATASYLWTSPSFFNGVSNKVEGMITLGVVANVPLCHPDAVYGVRIAKHKRNEVLYQIEEAKEKIELQVTKLNYELEVANKKLVQAQSNLVNAEENLKLAQESFAAGVISSSDLMAAQTAWMSAKSDVVDAEVEIRLDYRNLCQAMGRK